MTVHELIEALTDLEALGYQDRIVVLYAGPQLDESQTVPISGLWAGVDSDEVVIETVVLEG